MSWPYWIAVGVGLAIGGTVGFLAVRNIGLTWAAIATRVGVFLFFAALSGYAAPFIAQNLFGGIYPEPPIEEEISAHLRQRPEVARMFRDFPEIEQAIRQSGADAYRKSGYEAMVAEIDRGVQEGFTLTRYYYMPRAQDVDLLRYTNELVRVLKELAKKDPILCGLWMSPQAGGEFIVSSDVAGVLGEDSMQSFEQAGYQAIAGAGVAIPDYDKSRAEAIVAAVGTDLIVRSGHNSLEMLAGRAPMRTADDARKVCLTAALLYERITQNRREDAVGALRNIFISTVGKSKPKGSSS
jgi:hypothetical protein